ncbi:hypothetical protein ABIB28_001150 [Sphingomonas sp. UYEF23]
MTAKVFKEARRPDGSIERFEPYPYQCGNYMRGDSTRSDEPMQPESTLNSLAAWIENRRANGLGGGVRMKSVLTGNQGLHTIAKIEIH